MTTKARLQLSAMAVAGALLALLSPAIASSHELPAVDYDVHGIVRGTNGLPLSDAAVSDGLQWAFTDANGSYRFHYRYVGPTNHQLTAIAPCHRDDTQQTFTVTPGDAVMNFALATAPC